MMRLDAKFVTSAFAPQGYPRWERAEVALAGRSNVGKSSMLNALAAVKNLARTSRTPGRTRALNFFSVGDDLAIVDLPGYGFAKMPRTEATRVAAMMNDYLSQSEHLAGLVMLIDARRGPEREELELATLADARGVKLIVVATKCDKLRRSERSAALVRFKALGIEPILCSALRGEGIDELRRRIAGCAGDARRVAAAPADSGGATDTPSR
jgi:GTP-binding protein